MMIVFVFPAWWFSGAKHIDMWRENAGNEMEEINVSQENKTRIARIESYIACWVSKTPSSCTLRLWWIDGLFMLKFT